jgi:coenzyme F420-dependent glucose-6-phosphate dehydrogenase
MLAEAIEIIRLLWSGGFRTHRGRHYTVGHARLYTLPEQLPPIHVAAKGERAARIAAELGDGLIAVGPDPETVKTYREAGGDGPRFAQLHHCWGEDEREARKLAHAVWPNAAIGGELSVDLPLPRHFEQAAEMVTEDDVADAIPCGPDPERHVKGIHEALDAGSTTSTCIRSARIKRVLPVLRTGAPAQARGIPERGLRLFAGR